MSELIEQLAPEAGDDGEFGAVRRRARKALMQHGFPDLKTEAWKYTSLKVLQKRSFEAVDAGSSAPPELPFEAVIIHFDHGLLDPENLQLPDGVRIEALSASDLESVEYGDRADAFAWLNLASFEQAWRLVIEADQAVPLVLASTTANDFSGAVHPRLAIEVRDGASVSLVEVQHDQGKGLVNVVEDIEVTAGARLDHHLVRQHADSVWVQRSRVRVHGNGDYHCHVLDTGGRLNRQDLNIELLEADARGEIDGVARIDSGQHVDYHTSIDHVVGQTNSRETFHILADGTGVGVFNGRIHIHRGADDSHSDLNTANLLLSDSARINTKPELEIYAEDVTASHGATVGQLDDSALFYMRSRGIPASEATALLKLGFATAPLENIGSEPIRKWLIGLLREIV